MARQQRTQHRRRDVPEEARQPGREAQARAQVRPQAVLAQHRLVAAHREAHDIEGTVQHAVSAAQQAGLRGLVDIEGDGLVLGLLDHVPKHERDHARVGAEEQRAAFLHEPAGDADGHGLEAGGIGEARGQRALRESRIGGFHLGLDFGQVRIAIALEHVVEAAMRAEVHAFLRDEGLGIGAQARLGDQRQRLADRADQEGLEIRHGQRGAVDHVRKLGLVRNPVRPDVVRELEGNAPRHDLAAVNPLCIVHRWSSAAGSAYSRFLWLWVLSPARAGRRSGCRSSSAPGPRSAGP